MEVGQQVIYPGIKNSFDQNLNPFDDKSSQMSHYYYQWVWFILLFEAICFYFPRWLWKMWESDKMSSLVSDLNFFAEAHVKTKKIELIVDYLIRTRGRNDWYAIKYFICEILALLNVFAQMAFIDAFLGGQFLTYGSDFIRYLRIIPENRASPMVKIFPRLTKCQFLRFGLSGNIEEIDTLCVLSLNIYNDKIFMFLWFWYCFLAIITGIVILFRFVLIGCPTARYYVCRWRFELSLENKDQNCDIAKLITRQLKIGDWFILHMLGQNVEPIIFGQILEQLVQKYKQDKNFAQNKHSVENNEIQNEKTEISYL